MYEQKLDYATVQLLVAALSPEGGDYVDQEDRPRRLTREEATARLADYIDDLRAFLDA